MTVRRLSLLLVPLLSAAPLDEPASTATQELSSALQAAADSFVVVSRGDGDDAGWPDLSDAARALQDRRVHAVSAMLGALPASGPGTPEARLLRDNLREAVDASIAARAQPVGSPPAREAAFTRFRTLPDAMRAERMPLQRGLDSGNTASAAVVEAVVRRLWRNESLRLSVLTGVHSPGEFRVNGPLSNLAAFAAAFGCKAGDPIVRDLTRKAVIS